MLLGDQTIHDSENRNLKRVVSGMFVFSILVIMIVLLLTFDVEWAEGSGNKKCLHS